MTGYGAHVTNIAGVAATTGGAIAAIANPEGVPLIITRCILDRTVKSTGAAAVDIGVAADGTTTSDNLIDGVAAGATEAAEDNIENGGTNGLAVKRWAAAEYVTVTGAATTVGLVGRLYLEYVRVKA